MNLTGQQSLPEGPIQNKNKSITKPILGFSKCSEIPITFPKDNLGLSDRE